MTRTIASAMTTAIAAAAGEGCFLLEFQFGSGTLRMATAGQSIAWNSQTWEAVGGALEIDVLPETTDDRGQGVGLTLSGVSQAVTAVLLGETYRGRLAAIWYARLDPAAGTIIADPLLLFRGFMNDGFAVTESRPAEGGGTCTISTRLGGRFAMLSRVNGVRCNVTSHRARIPAASTDTFFANVPALMGRPVYWGRKDPMYLTPFGGPSGDPRQPNSNPWGGGGIGGYTPPPPPTGGFGRPFG